MKLVLYALSLQLTMQSVGAVLKSIIISIAAVEINRESSQARRVSLSQVEDAILFPVRYVNRFSKGHAK